MSDEEWNILYLYLLERLRTLQMNSELQLNELMVEIEAAASTRIIESTLEQPSESRRLHSRDESDFERVTSRAPRAKEAFGNAISVLITRFREVPSLIDSLENKLGKSSDNIIWRPDARPDQIQVSTAEFNGAMMKITRSESEELEDVLKRLEHLIEVALNVNTGRN